MPVIPEPKPVVDRAIAELLASGDVLLESQRDQPNGFLGLDGNGDALGTFTSRRDTAANIAGIVLADGELAYSTDLQEFFIGDGTTAGGIFLTCTPRSTYGASITLPAYASVSWTNIPVRSGGTYEFTGYAFYQQDSDSQSNYQFNFDVSQLTALTLAGLFVRGYQESTWYLASSEQDSNRSLTYTSATTIQFAPITSLTQQEGRLRFRTVWKFGSSGNVRIAPSLRTAAISASPRCQLYHVITRRVA